MRTVVSKRKLKRWMAIRDFERFEDLAVAAKISPTTIYRIVETNKFNGKTLDAIAQALGVNPMDLLEAEGYPLPHMDAPALAGG